MEKFNLINNKSKDSKLKSIMIMLFFMSLSSLQYVQPQVNKKCYQELFPKIFGSGLQASTFNSAFDIYTDNVTNPLQPYSLIIGGETKEPEIHSLPLGNAYPFIAMYGGMFMQLMWSHIILSHPFYTFNALQFGDDGEQVAGVIA